VQSDAGGVDDQAKPSRHGFGMVSEFAGPIPGYSAMLPNDS
jgi:hypothetical protein